MSREFRGIFAYDLSKDIFNSGEIVNTEVIDQSIEDILSTNFGERLNLPSYGSILPTILFENLTLAQGEFLLNSLIKSIETWEDRIVILKDKCTLTIIPDSNTLEIGIAYIVKSTAQLVNFERSVSFNN